MKETAQFSKEDRSKLCAVVGDKFMGKAKALPDVITVERGHLISHDGGGTGDNNSKFHDVMVDEHSDGIEAIRCG